MQEAFWDLEDPSILINPVVAKTDMGKPLFKASDSGQIDILRQSAFATESELQWGSEM